MLMEAKNELEIISSAFTKVCVERFGNELLGIYFYGSSTTNDFRITSDYDFVAVIREVSSQTLQTVAEVLASISEVSGCDKLEGGFHAIEKGAPWKDTVGIWVDKGMKVSKCMMHIEHDSVFAICTSGMHCYGMPPLELLPKLTEAELLAFEKKYILEFVDNMPRRSETAQRLYGALLNACRSACYILDKKYMTKTESIFTASNMT